ncbi:MAG: TIR domain-containing protein [Christensenellales bacterium]
MARKTFISYKYSESQALRDKIINALGSDAEYYMGETSESPDLTDCKTSTILEHLKNMIFSTSVTIVILSPQMLKSKWIPWEIEYSLSCYSRDGRQSKQNGVVAVVQKVNGSYDWLQTTKFDYEKGFNVTTYNHSLLPEIINKNRYNSAPKKFACTNCKKYTGYSRCAECSTYDFWNGSYITFVEEETFLRNPQQYIENAFTKSQMLEHFFTTKRIDQSA